MDINKVFERLWNDYADQNPSVRKIHDLFISEGEIVVNDHIAFRTLDYPIMDIDVLAKPFISAGYAASGEYTFVDKHLFARHFERPGDQGSPRVFISQLLLKECSDFVQKTFGDLTSVCDQSVFASDELIYSGSLYHPLSYGTYERLRDESEYAAWFYVFGFRANHFTVSINSLKKYDEIEKVNDLLRSKGFLLNNSGGEIKGTRAELLRQSSTMADIVQVKFVEGVYDIPSCYYEFAQRFPGSDGVLYGGFNAKSADRIFESTNFYTTRHKKSDM